MGFSKKVEIVLGMERKTILNAAPSSTGTYCIGAGSMLI
jgi:hypothetical protein